MFNMVINENVERKVRTEGIFSLNNDELREFYYNFKMPNCGIDLKDEFGFKGHYTRECLVINALCRKGFTLKEAAYIMADWMRNVDNYKSESIRYIAEKVYN